MDGLRNGAPHNRVVVKPLVEYGHTALSGFTQSRIARRTPSASGTRTTWSTSSSDSTASWTKTSVPRSRSSGHGRWPWRTPTT